MGKKTVFFGGISAGLVIVYLLALAFIPVDSAIPPTPAYSTFNIMNNVTWPNTTITNITATTYNDNGTLAADNSILLNITSVNDTIVLSVDKSPFIFKSYSDATRMTCEMSIEGGVIWNTDNLNLNLCNGTNWILPDGSPT